MVVRAARSHLVPSRTQQLSSPAPMVLRGSPRGRVGHRQQTRSSFSTQHISHPHPTSARQASPPWRAFGVQLLPATLRFALGCVPLAGRRLRLPSWEEVHATLRSRTTMLDRPLPVATLCPRVGPGRPDGRQALCLRGAAGLHAPAAHDASARRDVAPAGRRADRAGRLRRRAARASSRLRSGR